MESFDYSSISIQEIPVIGPDKVHYTLREATGKVATDHRNAVMASTQFGPDGKVTGFRNLASVEASFVAGCLWDPNGRNPSAALVQSWPARVQKQLYEKAKEISELGEEATIRKALEKAFERIDRPVDIEDLENWAEMLGRDAQSDEYRAFTRLFERKRNLKN